MRNDIRYNNIIDSDEARIAQAAADAAPALPSAQIDPTRFYITQKYHLYTRDNHEVWCDLWEKRWTVLEQQASDVFLRGLKAINLTRERIPLLFDTVADRDLPVSGGATLAKGTPLNGINRYLKALTGWSSYGVPGYLPAKAFFACLANRQFPTTVLIRPREVMDYLPEPDIFHDVFGHVPLHADPVFADFLQTYGRAALHCEDPAHIERLGRLFWFTVEFGLIRESGRLKTYGSGLISSHAESEYALASPVPERRPFDLDRVCDTSFEIDKFQPVYYVLESFEQLRDAMNRYAARVLGGGKLAA